MGGTGGVPPAGRIVKALRPLIDQVAESKGLTIADTWSRIRPYWQKFCSSRGAKFGPESFAQNPKQVIEDQEVTSRVGAMIAAL